MCCKKIILIGTSHTIQEGKKHKEEFQEYLNALCKQYDIKAIAEETKNIEMTVGYSIFKNLMIGYLVIEPKEEDYNQLGIEHLHHIEYSVKQKSGIDPFPEIEELTDELKQEYLNRINEHMRKREQEWLKKIIEFNQYPCLVIFGADHFNEFFKLLEDNNFEVIKNDSSWKVDQSMSIFNFS